MYYFCRSMLFRLSRYFLIVLVPVVLLSACSKFNRTLKSEDNEYKLSEAKKYYDKKDYYRAGLLYDDLLTVFRASERAQEIYYYYAYCKYHMYEFPSAAFHFKNFYESYPNSKYAEEAFFMYALSNYMESYPYYLDPTYTLKAIEDFQLFVNVYPTSKFVEDCNKYIDDLRSRLERKAYKAAKLYYQIEEYEAAAVSFKNLLKDYPLIAEREEALFLISKSMFKLSSNSVEKKKKKRLEGTVEACNEYKLEYPQGPNIKEVLEYKQKAEAELAKMELNEKNK